MAIIVNNVGAGERLMYRVLLVDDEQIERMALAKKIDRYYGDKVNIYQAVNGREAVAMFSEQKNDIIITNSVALPSSVFSMIRCITSAFVECFYLV